MPLHKRIGVWLLLGEVVFASLARMEDIQVKLRLGLKMVGD